MRYTTRASTVLSIAELRARDFGHDYIGTEHMLLALIDEGGGIAASVLSELGVTEEARRMLVDVLRANGLGPGEAGSA